MSPTITLVGERNRFFERSAFSRQSFYRSPETLPIIFKQAPGLGTAKRIDPRAGREYLERLLERFESSGLPGCEQVAAYLTHQYRQNRRPGTLRTNFTAIRLFLEFIRKEGKCHLEEITRSSLEGFVEQEQDRGMKPASVRGRLGCVNAFLRFLIEEGVVRHEVLSKRITVKLPESLPRAMDPEDVKVLLGVIDNTRNRAMILMLLRTGMRIGELLALRLEDISLHEQKVMIHEANKTGVGRVVYFSADAREALLSWLKEKDPREDVLFYGRSVECLAYSTARVMFKKYLGKAGLLHKGYSLHSLRHTYATELLNAGMRLECLQPLLGHTNLEVTRRYARLTDKTREEEYFRAMAVIERGENGEPYRFDHQL
jgi:integrase/recombinase XerD